MIESAILIGLFILPLRAAIICPPPTNKRKRTNTQVDEAASIGGDMSVSAKCGMSLL